MRYLCPLLAPIQKTSGERCATKWSNASRPGRSWIVGLGYASCAVRPQGFQPQVYGGRRPEANQRLRAALDVLWLRTTRFSEDCAQQASMLQAVTDEADRLKHMLRTLHRSYVTQVETHVASMASESLPLMRGIEAEIAVRRSLLQASQPRTSPHQVVKVETPATTMASEPLQLMRGMEAERAQQPALPNFSQPSFPADQVVTTEERVWEPELSSSSSLRAVIPTSADLHCAGTPPAQSPYPSSPRSDGVAAAALVTRAPLPSPPCSVASTPLVEPRVHGSHCLRSNSAFLAGVALDLTPPGHKGAKLEFSPGTDAVPRLPCGSPGPAVAAVAAAAAAAETAVAAADAVVAAAAAQGDGLSAPPSPSEFSRSSGASSGGGDVTAEATPASGGYNPAGALTAASDGAVSVPAPLALPFRGRQRAAASFVPVLRRQGSGASKSPTSRRTAAAPASTARTATLAGNILASIGARPGSRNHSPERLVDGGGPEAGGGRTAAAAKGRGAAGGRFARGAGRAAVNGSGFPGP